MDVGSEFKPDPELTRGFLLYNPNIAKETKEKNKDHATQQKEAMVKEATAQAKLGVGVETLWKALVEDLRFIIPKLMPNTVENIELLHGNGGIGSVLLFHLGPVVEGIMLKRGFSSFKTTFNLSSMGEKETLVDIKVVYETERDGEDEVEMKEAATKPALSFLQLLEKFLLHSSSLKTVLYS
ncbi:Phytohormone-binding protein, partial [Cucurbita argyrosperma subsp. argyrosperma]